MILEEITQQYKLDQLQQNGWVYIEIKKGIYGLPQAGIFTNHQLTEHLSTEGYVPVRLTPGLWKHTTWDASGSRVK